MCRKTHSPWSSWNLLQYHKIITLKRVSKTRLAHFPCLWAGVGCKFQKNTTEREDLTITLVDYRVQLRLHKDKYFFHMHISECFLMFLFSCILKNSPSTTSSEWSLNNDNNNINKSMTLPHELWKKHFYLFVLIFLFSSKRQQCLHKILTTSG